MSANITFYPLSKEIRYTAILTLIIATFSSIVRIDFVQKKIDSYAIHIAEKSFGSKPLAKDVEEKIRAIALEMNIADPIIIRKMNQSALSTYGYCNAMAYFPQLFNIIPISNKAFLFISEDFLEDLSLEEQRFLIGHEMVHIQERHTKYLNLLIFLIMIVLGIFVSFVHKYLASIWHIYASSFFMYIFLALSILITQLTRRTYQRHIERVADYQSLAILNSYAGGVKLTERWEKEYKHPLVNPYYGLFADHPACGERKLYCLKLQDQAKEKL